MSDLTTGGIDARDLDRVVRGLIRANPKLKPEAIKIMRVGVKKMQSAARARIGRGGYRLGMDKRMIGMFTHTTGAAIELRQSRYPYAFQAEFGERWANIPIYRGPGRRGGTRLKRQKAFRRKTVARLRQPTSRDPLKNRGGYMIQPVIRLMTPKLIEKAEKGIVKLIDKELKRG